MDRRLSAVLERARRSARVVVVNGPRQSGKTTLLREHHRRVGGSFVSLDIAAELRQARLDPVGFVSDLPKPLHIDEVQRGGDPLVLAIKAAVDADPEPGRFVLAGSTRFLTVPSLSESLAGRVRILDLWPLSQGELHAGDDHLVDALFAERSELGVRGSSAVEGRADVAARIVRGGFPGFAKLDDELDRTDLIIDFLRSVTERDIRELTQVRRAVDLPRLLALVAARTAQELVVADLARDAGHDRHTVEGYLALFETLFVHHRLPAWSGNLNARTVRRPKLHMVDASLAAAILGLGEARLTRPTEAALGPLLETFVVSELAKQCTWSPVRPRLYHLRERSGIEVDVVIETSDGRVAGVEVKASRDVGDGDLRGLRALADRCGDRFVAGVVVTCGGRVRNLGPRMWALPVSALWR